MNRLRDIPIRSKLVLIIMTVSLSTLLIAGIAAAVYNVQNSKQAMVHEFTSVAKLLGNRSNAALLFDDNKLADENLGSLKDSPHVVLACIYNKDSKLFSQYRNKSYGLNCESILSEKYDMADFDDDYLQVRRAIVIGAELLGYIVIQSDLQRIQQQIFEQIVIVIIALGIAGVFTFFLSTKLQLLISKPIRGVASVAIAIEKQADYSLRAPETGSDEIGRLTHAFNGMLDTIENQNIQLQSSKDNLEALVSFRTRELVIANQELESFSYSVSHDLRAPLRSIDGFSLMLLEDYANCVDEAGKDYLARIRASAQRMSYLIDDLLKLSRVTTSEYENKIVNLTGLAQASIKYLKEQEPNREVDVIIQPGVEASGDPQLLGIVFDNLIGNAWKYTGKTQHARIEFGARLTESGTEYYIKDNGAGFDMKYSDKLFGAFNRLHKTSEFEGSGIGLATVKRIIDRHSGKIWGQAEVNKGAVFYFTIGSNLGFRNKIKENNEKI